MEVTPEISLLWPDSSAAAGAGNRNVLAGNAAGDLGIDTLVERLRFPAHLRVKLRELLLAPLSDAEAIRYRQDVLEDLLNNPRLVTRLEELLRKLAHLGYLSDYPFQTTLEKVTARLGELEVYIDCVHMLQQALE